VWFRGWPYVPFLAAAYELIMAAGLLLLANEERRYPDKWKGYKWGCRIVAGLLVIAAIASLVIGFAGRRQFLAFGFTEVSLNVSIVAATLATVAYLRPLAKRIPSSKAARLCAWMMLAPAVSLLKAFPLYTFFMMLDFGGVIIAWLPMLFLPATAGLLVWFARSFKRASHAARQGWEAESATTAHETC
jgi:hypothetical protein